ncbi:Gustatory receptor 68a [Eumeta japonica]|uniref:Gustatory receptor 68a n=1 Tax=Eumeta variegata TaxID=151549 RepID=A0A4C1U800_EUMVA|nr:Gustatory receptor 68a [Eumeta japonica]
MLKCRMDVLNDYLRKHVHENDPNGSKIKITKAMDKVAPLHLKDLGMMYDAMGETCSYINEIFNYQILMTLASTFTYVLATISSSLQYLRTPNKASETLTMIVMWCMKCICTVTTMCLGCDKLASARNDTKVLVNDIIMDYERPPQTRLLAKAFMELTKTWRMKISVYDMFFVDITLILKFISVATTYLIVIIQISHFIK